jgi:hypothetical protein
VATADGIKLVSEEFSGNFSYGTATIAAAGARLPRMAGQRRFSQPVSAARHTVVRNHNEYSVYL